MIFLLCLKYEGVKMDLNKCGKPVNSINSEICDNEHIIKVSEIEDDFYIEMEHDMTKDHFIKFVAYVGVDRVIMVRLYPEQGSTVRLPRMFRGKIYFYCTRHGLYEYKI